MSKADAIVLGGAAVALVVWPALLAFRLGEDRMIPRIRVRRWVRRFKDWLSPWDY